MSEIRLHPAGFPVVPVDSGEVYGTRWFGFQWREGSGLTAFAFENHEAVDWPRLVVEQ
jgi:hypothetical protein